MNDDAGMFAALAEGFLLGAGLIIAIGAQNAFVLRQGIARRHVGLVVLICALSDAVLIAIGVAGAGAVVGAYPALLDWVTIAGALFLVLYGGLALTRALQRRKSEAREESGGGAAAVVAACLALTFLNPHVYLDTVVLIGAVSARYTSVAAIAFAAGAMGASVLWFASLGYGARLAAPVFATPVAWRVLDGAVAVVMFAIAARLLSQTLLV